MCKAFSGIIDQKGRVYWQMAIDSHDRLIEKFGLKDDTADKDKMAFARFEISPKNGNYLTPDRWVFKLDEQIKPTWWNKGYEQFCRDAWREWKADLDKILIYKPTVHPFKIKPPKKITKKHLELLKKWASVGDSVGDSVRASVWVSVGDSVWDSVWVSVGDSAWVSVRDSVGDSVWASAWVSVGDSVWVSVRDSVGDSVGVSVWVSVRDSVGDSVGAYVGSFFRLPRDAWKHTEKIKCTGYPFQPAVDLWEMGLVPSFDGEKWRLHGRPDGKILWEGKI